MGWGEPRWIKASIDLEMAIRSYLETDELFAHSQLVGRTWEMNDPASVDNLVGFLERAINGIDKKRGLSGATRTQAVQEVEVPEVRVRVHQPYRRLRRRLRAQQDARTASLDETGG